MKRWIAFFAAFAYGLGLFWIGGVDLSARSPELATLLGINTVFAVFVAGYRLS